jgi:hypothetical protein
MLSTKNEGSLSTVPVSDISYYSDPTLKLCQVKRNNPLKVHIIGLQTTVKLSKKVPIMFYETKTNYSINKQKYGKIYILSQRVLLWVPIINDYS